MCSVHRNLPWISEVRYLLALLARRHALRDALVHRAALVLLSGLAARLTVPRTHETRQPSLIPRLVRHNSGNPGVLQTHAEHKEF